MWFKYVVKNVARKHGKTATFMPKPLFGDNGSGHARAPVALEGGQAPLRRRRLRGLSARWRSTTSAASSSTRSRSRRSPTRRRTRYRRLVPGFEAPVNLAYSSRNRSASRAHPDHRPEPEDAPHRGALPRPELQPVPRVQRDADGRARRHPEQDRPGRSARQGHLRPLARGAEGRAAHAGQPRGGARHAREGPRVPAPRRRLHEGRDPRVARLQAQRRS